MTARRALVVPVDPIDPTRVVTWDTDDALLPLLHGVIETSMVQVVTAELDVDQDDRVVTVWCDEDGWDRVDPQVNERATTLTSALLGAMPPVLGTVVLTGGVDEVGDTLGLSDVVLAELQRALAPSGVSR